MSRALSTLCQLQREYRNTPVIIAGDIFDRWNASAEVINYALWNLPDDCYAIPGQHDLAYHNNEQLDRTAFGVLVNSGKIKSIADGDPSVLHSACVVNDLVIHGFPWGRKPCSVDIAYDALQKRRLYKTWRGRFQLGVIHSYCWKGSYKYPDAPVSQSVTAHRKAYKGFDALLFGDNHKGFIDNTSEGPSIANGGAFIARKTDEMKYRPFISLLRSNGDWVPYDTFEEDAVWSTEHIDKLREREDVEAGFQKFINSLRKSQKGGVDFEEVCLRAAQSLGSRAKQFVLEVLDDIKS